MRLRNSDLTWVIIDHEAKPSLERGGFTSPFGSIYKTAIARNIWRVSKQGPGSRTAMGCSLELQKNSFDVWHPDPLDLVIEGLRSPQVSIRLIDVIDAVVAAVVSAQAANHGEPAKVGQIAAKLAGPTGEGVSVSYARELLKRAVDRGLLRAVRAETEGKRPDWRYMVVEGG